MKCKKTEIRYSPTVPKEVIDIINERTYYEFITVNRFNLLTWFKNIRIYNPNVSLNPTVFKTHYVKISSLIPAGPKTLNEYILALESLRKEYSMCKIQIDMGTIQVIEEIETDKFKLQRNLKIQKDFDEEKAIFDRIKPYLFKAENMHIKEKEIRRLEWLKTQAEKLERKLENE